MSNNLGVSTTSPSRRSVVKGAAWAVPAIAVASAAPTVAASTGFLTFTGSACKLPGSSSSNYKGYVFELLAHNATGPLPRDAVTVIDSITIQGIADPGGYKVVVKDNLGGCSCGPCGSDPNHEFCTADGVANQRILLYTSSNVTGNSANSVVTVTYRVFDCNNTSSCGTAGPTQTTSTTIASTPTAQENGGGNCKISGIFPLPV